MLSAGVFTKKIYIDLLRHLSENQSADMLWNTDPNVLCDRLGYTPKKMGKAKEMLIHSGCIKANKTNTIITEKGKTVLENHYKFKMESFLGRFIAITSILAIIISVVSLLVSIEKHNKPSQADQSSSVRLIVVKSS